MIDEEEKGELLGVVVGIGDAALGLEFEWRLRLVQGKVQELFGDAGAEKGRHVGADVGGGLARVYSCSMQIY